jgi:hypothetical protein
MRLCYCDRCNEHELDAIWGFTRWQQISVVSENVGTGVLKMTNGRMEPALVKDGVTLAIGFFKIIEYFQNAGMVLC